MCKSKHLSVFEMNLTNFIVLFNIVNETLYVNQPLNTLDCFICLNEANDTWPENYMRMQIESNTLPKTCSFKITEPGRLKLKVSYYLSDWDYYTSDWLEILQNRTETLESQAGINNTKSISKDNKVANNELKLKTHNTTIDTVSTTAVTDIKHDDQENGDNGNTTSSYFCYIITTVIMFIILLPTIILCYFGVRHLERIYHESAIP